MPFGQADIQALINQGSGFGAAVVGAPCDWRRALQAVNGLGPASRMGMVQAYFDPDYQFMGKKPNLYGHPTWGAFYDRTLTRVGDYLFAPSGTYFVIAQQPLLPTSVVECNATLTITRAVGIDLAHEDQYGGRTDGTDGTLMAGWPASLLLGGRNQAGRADLPGDVQDKGFQALLPLWPGVVPRTSDRVTDTDTGRNFTVGACEITDLGARMDLILSVT